MALSPTTNQVNDLPKKAKKENQTLKLLKLLSRNKGAVIGFFVICVIVFCAIFSPLLSPYGYADIDMDNMFAKPSWEHPFGCDELGRDILSRVMYGGRFSVQIGFYATLLATICGITFGSLAGYYGGMADSVIMRIMDVVQAIPGMLLSIAIASVLGNGLVEMSIALGVGNIPQFTRILRGSILTVRKSEYLDAAKADGTTTLRMIRKHVLPNSISPIIVQATLGCANVILLASSLSFIGLGIKPPNPEWGAMLSAGRGYFRDYTHLLLFPGIAIALIVLSLNLLGDGLRDALDPRMKK